MFSKRMTIGRRIWHIVSWLVAVASVVVIVASADKPESTSLWYLVAAAALLLAATPGAMDSLRLPCSVCGGVGEIAAGSWTLPFESNTCTHCKGTGEEPVDTLDIRTTWW